MIGVIVVLGLALSQAAPAQSPVVARVGGVEIHEDELQAAAAGQLRQLRTQEHEAKTRALETIIQRKLLEEAAKKEGIAPEALLARDVDTKVAAPTDAEVEAFYLGQRDRLNRPLEQVKAQLTQSLRQFKQQRARQEYMANLRTKAKVEVLLKPPRTAVAYDESRVRGDRNAPVTIVEFSDFQCPYCQRVHGTIKEVLAKYDGKVKLAYRDLPLREIHPRAQPAAEASRCAGEQGKFWEYHDLLYTNPTKLDAGGLNELAAKAGLDTAKFEACVASAKYREAVNQDLDEARRLGVSGTPAFFVNGIFLSGAVAKAEFEKLIEAELAAKE